MARQEPGTPGNCPPGRVRSANGPASTRRPATTPAAPVFLDGSGALYGATADGGAGNFGTIWKLVGHTITALTSFVGVDVNGAQDLTSDGAGHLFGDGPGGASGAGAAFELDTTAAAPTPKVLVSFDAAGLPSLAQLTISADTIYGTLEHGGTNGAGEVAEVDPVTGVTQAVAYSPADALGQPVGKVVVDADGDLFGTASVSGVQDPVTSGYQGGVAYGGVYEVTPATVAAAADPPHLVFTAAPTAAQSAYSAGPDGHTKVASVALGTFQVTVEDAAGRVSDVDDGSDVTLTGGGGFGYGDSGVLTVSPEPVVDGVATFTDAVVTYTGDVTTAVDDGIYSLRADDDIDVPGYSTGVTVDPPVPHGNHRDPGRRPVGRGRRGPGRSRSAPSPRPTRPVPTRCPSTGAMARATRRRPPRRPARSATSRTPTPPRAGTRCRSSSPTRPGTRPPPRRSRPRWAIRHRPRHRPRRWPSQS